MAFERVVRRSGGAVQHGVRPDGVDQLLLARDHAEGGIVQAGDALRRRVEREVHAVGQRLLPERCGERRVDDGDRTTQRTELVEVDQLEARVRW